MASLSSFFFVCLALVFVTSLPNYCGRSPGISPSAPSAIAGTLKQVQVVMRHGDRMIAEGDSCWPNDTAVFTCDLTSTSVPNLDLDQTMTNVQRLYRKNFVFGEEDYAGNCGLGELTDFGYQQQYENGQTIRQLYIESVPFLSNQTNPSEFYIFTDEIDRCVASAQGLFLGLYPVSNTSSKPAEILDMFTVDSSKNYIEPNPSLCPVLDELYAEAATSEEFLKHQAEVTLPLLDLISKRIGIESSEPLTLGDCLNVHLCHSFPIPLPYELYLQLQNDMTWTFNYIFNYPNSTIGSKFSIGFLLNHLYQNMLTSISGQEDPRFYLYSAHDMTLWPILTGFQIYNGEWPPYATMLIFELWQVNTTSSGFAVRVLYNTEVLTVPGCGSELCDWEVFQQIMSKLVLVDPKECARKKPEPKLQSPLDFMKKIK